MVSVTGDTSLTSAEVSELRLGLGEYADSEGWISIGMARQQFLSAVAEVAPEVVDQLYREGMRLAVESYPPYLAYLEGDWQPAFDRIFEERSAAGLPTLESVVCAWGKRWNLEHGWCAMAAVETLWRWCGAIARREKLVHGLWDSLLPLVLRQMPEESVQIRFQLLTS